MAANIIDAIARSLRVAINNQNSNMGVGAQSGQGSMGARFINQSAFLRMRQACLGIVQEVMGTLGWGPYFTATALAVAVGVLKNVQQARGNADQLATLKHKSLDRWLAGFAIPAAILAVSTPHYTSFFNQIYDRAEAEANAVLTTQQTDVGNVAAAQLMVSQGNT